MGYKFGVIKLNNNIWMTELYVPDSASGPSPPVEYDMFDTANNELHAHSRRYSRGAYFSVGIDAAFRKKDSCTLNTKYYQQYKADTKYISRVHCFSDHLTADAQLITYGKNHLSFAKKFGQSFFTKIVTLEGGSGNYQPGIPVTPPDNTDPDENGYYFHDTFKGDIFSWEGSGFA